MDKEEYMRRCAAYYKLHANITDELANQMAAACWDNRDLDDPVDPESDAYDDMSCWDNDE